ncbi:hypothetical protein BDP27DRAFT_1452676 [Rhodocollybia butyracea]|uniref:Uncharacterized protein n=1 Tax=Rhodocollybia butyracea TaxID=206335 RepID=A0A9P5PBN8_9AGAR|nr:hypothetical protein BDP27DRAFT_1452676 [Rhodocollybia butyracea]
MRLNSAYLVFLVAYVVNAVPVVTGNKENSKGLQRTPAIASNSKGNDLRIEVTFTKPKWVTLSEAEPTFQSNVDKGVREVIRQCEKKGRIIPINAIPKDVANKNINIEFNYNVSLSAGYYTGKGHLTASGDGDFDRSKSFGCSI